MPDNTTPSQSQIITPYTNSGTQPVSPLQKKGNGEWINPLLIGLGICCAIVLIILLWVIFFGGKQNKFIQDIEQKIDPNLITVQPTVTPTTAVIAGSLNFQGYAPPDAYVAIAERPLGGTTFRDVVTGLATGQTINWTWPGAIDGKNYEMKAVLKSKNQELQESAITEVSAPAQAVSFSILSDEQPPQSQQAAISGTIHLNGYIPTGSTVTVSSELTDNTTFTPVVSHLPAQDNTPWSWTTAVAGQTYEIEIQLYNASGTLISANQSKTITAPSSGLLFSVTSTSQPVTPITSAGLSGSITLNGTIPANSYITLGTRPTGTSTFTPFGSQLTATNGVSWQWNSAQAGKQYDIQAYLWSNGKPYSQSNVLTIAAPSVNNVLTINAQQPMSAPSDNTLSVICNNAQNNLYQATITYNTTSSIQNAQQYKVLVTQASNGNQIINTTLTPGSPSQPQSLTTGYQFTNSTTYIAQYAYSSDGTNFSPFSPSAQFSCP